MHSRNRRTHISDALTYVFRPNTYIWHRGFPKLMSYIHRLKPCPRVTTTLTTTTKPHPDKARTETHSFFRNASASETFALCKKSRQDLIFRECKNIRRDRNYGAIEQWCHRSYISITGTPRSSPIERRRDGPNWRL